MKKTFIIIFLLVSLNSGCTLLEVESTKTETVNSTKDKDQSRYERLEARIEDLEKRLKNIEDRGAVSIGGGRGGTQPVSK